MPKLYRIFNPDKCILLKLFSTHTDDNPQLEALIQNIKRHPVNPGSILAHVFSIIDPITRALATPIVLRQFNTSLANLKYDPVTQQFTIPLVLEPPPRVYQFINLAKSFLAFFILLPQSPCILIWTFPALLSFNQTIGKMYDTLLIHDRIRALIIRYIFDTTMSLPLMQLEDAVVYTGQQIHIDTSQLGDKAHQEIKTKLSGLLNLYQREIAIVLMQGHWQECAANYLPWLPLDILIQIIQLKSPWLTPTQQPKLHLLYARLKNRKRIHSTNDYLSPVDFEARKKIN